METQPLLKKDEYSGEVPNKEDVFDEKDDSHYQGTWTGSVFTVMTCAVGSGVLSLPFAFREMGLILGIILLFILSVITYYSLHLLIVCAEKTRQATFQGVANKAFGAVGKFAAKIILFTTCFGAMVGYLIIIGDLLSPVVCEWSGNSSDCSVDLIYLNRNFLVAISIATVILPLAFFSKMHQLEKSSFLAVASVMCLIVVVLWRSIEHVANEGSNFQLPKLFNFSLLGFAQALPIIAFALGCHIQVIPIYAGLQHDIRKVRTMDSILFAANSFSTTFYLVVGFFGYLQFGLGTDGNILLNYSPSDIVALIGRLAMGFHVALAFPLLVWPARNVLDELLFGTEYKVTRRQQIRHAIETLALVFCSWGVAIVVPNITTVFGFTGSVCSICSNFIFPAAFYLKLIPTPSLWKQKIPAALVVVSGILAGVISTAVLTYKAIMGLPQKKKKKKKKKK